MFIVTIYKLRPDFRVFIDLLFGYGRNVDTDGDSDPVWSRDWRDLYIKDRESQSSKVEIYAPDDAPDCFSITSESERLAELAALYLYLFCGESIEREGQALDIVEIDRLKTTYATELAQAEQSIWHLSSAANPFPNLTRGNHEKEA